MGTTAPTPAAMIPCQSCKKEEHVVRSPIVTRLLIALILVPTLAGVSIAQVDAQAQSSATPQDTDLSLAREAGTTVIGLTLRSGQPGPNTLLIYVLPLEGAAAAADVPIG